MHISDWKLRSIRFKNRRIFVYRFIEFCLFLNWKFRGRSDYSTVYFGGCLTEWWILNWSGWPKSRWVACPRMIWPGCSSRFLFFYTLLADSQIWMRNSSWKFSFNWLLEQVMVVLVFLVVMMDHYGITVDLVFFHFKFTANQLML